MPGEKMTSKRAEEIVEDKVERLMSHFDSLLLEGKMSQKNYDAAVKDLAAWAEIKMMLLLSEDDSP
jgi:hypothetical protein